MSVLEIITSTVQNQSSNRRVSSEEVEVSLEVDSSLQTSEGDMVTLSFADKHNLSNSYNDSQFEGDRTIQEISSVARAASKYSQVVEENLNEDELIAIKGITAHVEPIVKEFLSSDPEVLDVEKAIGILTGDPEITERVGTELVSAIVETLEITSSSQIDLDNQAQLESIVVDGEKLDINIENIRQLPELATVAVDAELQKQFQVLNESSRELIVSSLNDLMRFFQEKISKVLEPLSHPIPLASEEMDLVEAKPQA
jgi:hypothetical protein